MQKKIAIIGAGPSGLAQLRAFQSHKEKEGEKGGETPEITCFEKQEDWGGLWRYTWRSGLDQYGEPVHGSMYRYLWSNGPKEGLEFADYTFEEHFGKPIASYPPRAVLYDYIEGRIKKAGVRQQIKFNTNVKWVEYNSQTKTFALTSQHLPSGKTSVDNFDYVIVANGHFSTPNVPEFEGFDNFNGRILHAHDFRDAVEFKNKEILIIGTSYSAEDIGSQCWKYGCKHVTISHRTAPIGYDWPPNWQEVPLLKSVAGNTCTFIDGTTKNVDAIILCTGYLHHFPFMHPDIKLQTENRLATAMLYKGVSFIGNQQLFYLGMQDQWYTFNMFDAQAWWARDVILGKIKLPDIATQTKDVEDRRTKEDTLESAEDCIRYQGNYVRELIAETDYPSFDVDASDQAFIQWKKDKKKGIMTFRDNAYKSPMTGNMAPIHHTPWQTAMDDSLESYLKETK